MPTVDFTLEDLKRIFATKADLRREIGSVKQELMQELKKVEKMLDENLRAESGRVDRVQKRTRKTQKELAQHASDATIHGGGQ